MTTAPKKSELLKYSFIALPLAFAGLPLYVHAPDFYTRDLGMDIALIGVILMAVRMFDAIQDPIIGYISDKYTHHRTAIIAAGTLMLLIGMAAIFHGPQMTVPAPFWFASSMIIATTGFSIVTINLNMIGGFWHDQPNQRTRISAWREAFALVGLLIASVLPAALQNIKPAEDAFRILFWTFGVIMIVGFIMFTRFMSRISAGHKISKSDKHKGLSFLQILTGPDKHFFGVCFLTHLAAAIPGVMVLFFINDYLNAEKLSGLFLFLYFIAGAALMPVWVMLSNKIGKEKAWLASMVLAVTTFIWAYFLQPEDIIAYGVICILSGMTLGADLALPPSMLADRITKQKTQEQATQYYALLAFIPKTAIALASGISFIILGEMGFIAGIQNSAHTLHGIITLYALIPCIIKAIAATYLYVSHKNEEEINEKTERTGSHGTLNVS